MEEELRQEAAIGEAFEATMAAPEPFDPSRSPRRLAIELSALALQQGIKPVERLEDLLGEPGAVEGLDVDAFLATRRD